MASPAYAEFERKGYVVLPEVLTAREVETWSAAIDEHRQRFSRLWMERGEGGRTQWVHVLLSRRELDDSILHARVLPLVIELVGEDIVCEEHSVIIRAPIDEDPPQPKWHRDTRHEPSHALGIHSLSVVYYLTDVDETTHCFSVVPEAAMTKRGAGSPECDGADGRDLLGPAGTAILLDAGSRHAGRLRKTTQPRRTVHIYYGHATQPPLSEHTIFPRRLIEHADPHVRRLFRRPNQITAAVHGLSLD